ncbi:hypothetical protein GCM10023187_24620 [Nibrella viscosa]|uniref:DUF4129 domain-containing protein n=1 Tax=Nibrella viscosa TaxID=1084524 RepID=A0ABP8KF41_9BACT
MDRKLVLITLFGWLLTLSLYAQQLPGSSMVIATPRPDGHFLTDSFEVGRPFRYSLSVRHPAHQEVIFPDTARQFAPFIVRGLAVYPTRTDTTGSLDSAVYTLVSFGTASAYLLRMPVYLVNPTDCTALWASTDTVFLRSALQTSRLDTLQLATITALAPVKQQFNYPYLLMALLVAALTAGIVYSIFGKAIERQWALYLLYQRHMRFLRNYNRLIRGMDPDTAADTANRMVVSWKIYLQKLRNQPFTSLTTREIVEQMADDRLADALKEVDRMVYGGTFSPQSQAALRVLREVATQAYYRRRETIRPTVPPAAPLVPISQASPVAVAEPEATTTQPV